ncbi:tetratricopeptide repeat protein [Chitinimonas sp. BJYL2]|uniref:tetratricopeptide repeat-containing glycosyltransferase family protein n=1 Tax=Chitinimonas sp. BJYL2 TaxID=2976696 RepID=UPI0022B4968D|nr:tetratricopeptide repeat protein [Chitinimonas sp. BJYL2]
MSDLQSRLSQAFARHQAGDLPAAEQGYRAVLAVDPNHWQAMSLLATIGLQVGNFAFAEQGFRASLQRQPKQPDAWLNLANAQRELRQLDAAADSLRQCLTLKPDYWQAKVNLANVEVMRKDYEEAISLCREVIAVVPDFVDAHHALGLALWEARALPEALAACDAALTLQPGAPETLLTRGHVLRALNQPEAGLQCYDAALAAQTDNAKICMSRADVLCELRRFDEALAAYDRALKLQPGDPDTEMAKGMTLLLMGEMAHGWQHYEARLRTPARAAELARFPMPMLSPDTALAGKHILLHGEQGFGDAIQFCRYACLLLEAGAKVTLAVRKPLMRLMQTLTPQIAVVDQATVLLSGFDHHCPLLSLPYVLLTRCPQIPATIPYLSAGGLRYPMDSDTGRCKPLRLGIVWSGSPTHRGDYARSIPLAKWSDLLAMEGLEVHSLQAQVRDADRAALQALAVHDHAEQLGDFLDTAALIEPLGLVITVDTSVAHLAGALGKPVWILIPHTPDFRWMLDRTDTPWYPQARLFRQAAPGDWDGVLNEVSVALRPMLSHAG